MRARIKLFTTARPAWLRWLIKFEISKYIRLNLTGGTREVLDRYLVEKLQLDIWNVSKIVSFALNHLHFRLCEGVQVVEVDSEIILPGTSYKVIDLLRLINYGNLEVRGSYVLTDAFRYLEQSMNRILARKVM